MKTWHDYLEQAEILISNGHCSDYSEIELAKRLFDINKSRDEEVAAPSPPNHNNTKLE